MGPSGWALLLLSVGSSLAEKGANFRFTSSCPTRPRGGRPRLAANTLRFVAIIARHGSRSPVDTFQNDPYPVTDPNHWPDGPGQLTFLGKVQMLEAGRNMRSKYNRFISKKYKVKDAHIASNPFERDRQSAKAFVKGFYPASRKSLPIPISNDTFDTTFFLTKEHFCPAFTEDKTLIIEQVNENIFEHKNILDYLRNYTGQSFNVLEMYKVWDAMQMQLENNKKFPAWAKEVFPALDAIAPKLLWTVTAGTDKMARLAGGPILRNVTDQMIAKALGRLKRKLYFDAAHDVTLITLFTLLGVREPRHVPTGSYLVFELHDYNEPKVQILYYSDSFCKEYHLIEMPDCKSPCPLRKFKQLVQQRTPRDWEEECQAADRLSTTPESLNTKVEIDYNPLNSHLPS